MKTPLDPTKPNCYNCKKYNTGFFSPNIHFLPGLLTTMGIFNTDRMMPSTLIQTKISSAIISSFATV